MKAGILQSPGTLGGPDDRLPALEQALRSAQDLDLLLCPELFQCGYNAGAEIATRSEALDGPFAAGVSGLAREFGCAIAYGFSERAAEGAPFNSAACFGPDGALLGHRRKSVLPPGPETELFQPGAGGPCLFRLGGLTVAIVICYEIEFPESARSAAMAGADVLLVPTAISTNWPIVPEKLVPTRAFENGLWLLYANHAGEENGLNYAGSSCIVAPFGEVAARAGRDPELIRASIDPGQVASARKRLPFLADRDDLLRDYQRRG